MFKVLNQFASLPSDFHSHASLKAATNPSLVTVNTDLIKELGSSFDELSNDKLAAYFSGNELLPGSDPIAAVYAGHQFGHFNPQLGDGRAALLGELCAKDGRIFDIQLKGSGRTKYSRGGDGLSAIGPVIREYLVSEAMAALDVPTTRALAAVTSGQRVYRETEKPGAILTRVATSHIRVGSFEYFASQNDFSNLKKLADFSIHRHDADLNNEAEKYFKFFQRVARRKLSLVAKWMGLGFIHGVMNTDNTSISGETIDYGPCAFMDAYSADKVFSSIDRNGRYAFSNQGQIALWNLSMLANCLFTLICDETSASRELVAEKLNEEFKLLTDFYEFEYNKVMARKLGLTNFHQEDKSLIKDYLNFLEDSKEDFTIAFYNLRKFKIDNSDLEKRWLSRITSKDEAMKNMKSANPVIIPRNHLVERAITYSENDQYDFFLEFHEVLKDPFNENLCETLYFKAPSPEEVVTKTFCGT